MLRKLLGLSVLALIVATLPAAHADSATVPTCFGKPATHQMKPGDPVYYTTTGKVDVVVGSSGADTVEGPGEDGPTTDKGDYICGGGGDDYIFGSAGPDHIEGGDGADTLKPWRGADTALGGAGSDIIDEGSQSDQDSANDVVHGGPGNDNISVGWGQDQAFGDAGNDLLYDTECDGPTTLDGGVGADFMESWSSSFDGWESNVCNQVADTIIGGAGTDQADVDKPDTVTTTETVHRIKHP
jgi:Ca2+-binding RTX toxin-like protein